MRVILTINLKKILHRSKLCTWSFSTVHILVNSVIPAGVIIEDLHISVYNLFNCIQVLSKTGIENVMYNCRLRF